MHQGPVDFDRRLSGRVFAAILRPTSSDCREWSAQPMSDFRSVRVIFLHARRVGLMGACIAGFFSSAHFAISPDGLWWQPYCKTFAGWLNPAQHQPPLLAANRSAIAVCANTPMVSCATPKLIESMGMLRDIHRRIDKQRGCVKASEHAGYQAVPSSAEHRELHAGWVRGMAVAQPVQWRRGSHDCGFHSAGEYRTLVQIVAQWQPW
jgi:hypothetical protein